MLIQGNSGNHEIIAGLRLFKTTHNGNIGTVGRKCLPTCMAELEPSTQIVHKISICPVLWDGYCEHDTFVDIF